MKEVQWAIGIDLGGTKVRIAQVDAAGQVQQERQVVTRVKEGASTIEADIVEVVQELIAHHHTHPKGVGVGIAGQINATTGMVHFAPNLGWRDHPLKANLSKRLSLPVSITNDVRAATLGEWLFGRGKGCRDLLCLFVGTGIGGGIVSGGQLLTGHANAAGEIGHTIIALNGPLCTCGNRGCLEALAAGWAIGQRAREAVKATPTEGKRLLELVSGKVEELTAIQVSQAAKEGDPLASRVLQASVQALATGCISFVHAFNPQKLVLGGGIIHAMPWIVDKVSQEVHAHALKAALQDLEIVPSQLMANAGVVGAAALALGKIPSMH